MLEYSVLQVGLWTERPAAGSAPTWVRHIAGAAGQPLGFVRFDGAVRSPFFSWLRSVRLEVYETDDASHLMSLVRAWGVLRIWDVYDAEERRVGSIYPPNLVDSEGQRRGFLEHHGPDRGKALDPANHVLATFQRRLDSLDLAFMPEPAPNPFLRMLILGAVLCLDPAPK